MRGAAGGSQGGFTLIECSMVVAIVGIMAALALPKFIDLSSQAARPTAASVAGAVSAGSAANFAARKAGKLDGTRAMGSPGTCSRGALGTLIQGGLPSGFVAAAALAGEDDCSVAGTATVSCSVAGAGGVARAVVYCSR